MYNYFQVWLALMQMSICLWCYLKQLSKTDTVVESLKLYLCENHIMWRSGIYRRKIRHCEAIDVLQFMHRINLVWEFDKKLRTLDRASWGTIPRGI
jgi:hypothetical protein